MRIVLPLVALLALASTVPATPLRCDDPCVVDTSYLGYLPPLVEIESGGRVVWHSSAGGHVQADTGQEATCFYSIVERGASSDPTAFRIVDDALRAGAPDEEGIACGNAQRIPQGGFELAYECVLHPNMRGAIVVWPTA